MDWKKTLLTSIEVWTGAGLTLAGIIALGLGAHGVIAQALAPFGIGLAVSGILVKAAQAAKAARERVKVPIRRDDDRDF